MIAVDQDDEDAAEKHARAALDLYQNLGDPWGILEARLLLVQNAILCGELELARGELDLCDAIVVNEAEPQQHRHLTRAWWAASRGKLDEAAASVALAQQTFPDPRRMGDHSAQLLQRFETLGWGGAVGAKVREWYESMSGQRATGQFAIPAERRG